jgi:hypothetical protein
MAGGANCFATIRLLASPNLALLEVQFASPETTAGLMSSLTYPTGGIE